jgi:hypothetical protein
MLELESTRLRSVIGAFAFVAIGIPAVEAEATSQSRFCDTSGDTCRVSSWLAPQDRQPVKQVEVQRQQLSRDSDGTPSVPSPSCTDAQADCRQSSWLRRQQPQVTPTDDMPGSKTPDQLSGAPAHADSVLAPPSGVSEPTAPPTSAPEASPSPSTVKPLALSGPPAYDAETGQLSVRRLGEQIGAGSTDTTNTANRYRLVSSLNNGTQMFGDPAEPPGPASRKSSWLQRLGWLDTPSLTVGTRIWFTQGKLGYNYALNGGGPDVVSELLWQGQNAKIYEVRADLVVRRFVSTLTLGWGHIGQGTLRDLDFAANSRSEIFSETLSSRTDGSVLYGSIDLGPRVFQWRYKDQIGAVDLLGGFQYWREQYTARGLFVFISPTLPSGTTLDANAVTTTATWHIIRLGPRFTVPLLPRLKAVGHVFYIPWTYYQNKDIHHLRTDLAQDPSFLDKASGGEGIQIEAGLQVRIWKALHLEGGWRYWDVRSGSGDSITFVPCTIVGGGGSSCGASQPDRLNEAKARRQGIFFGVDWQF